MKHASNLLSQTPGRVANASSRRTARSSVAECSVLAKMFSTSGFVWKRIQRFGHIASVLPPGPVARIQPLRCDQDDRAGADTAPAAHVHPARRRLWIGGRLPIRQTAGAGLRDMGT